MTDKLGSNFTGTFVNGVKSGVFTVDYFNHSHFEGLYKADIKNGIGIYAEPCYEQCFYVWKENAKFGKGFETLTFNVLNGLEIDFNALFQLNLTNSSPVNYTLDDSLGALYVGEFKDDLYHGNGTYISNVGDNLYLSTYVGDWRYGNKHGNGSEIIRALNISEPDQKYIGEYRNGEYHGEGIITQSNISCMVIKSYELFYEQKEKRLEGIVFNCTKEKQDLSMKVGSKKIENMGKVNRLGHTDRYMKVGW